MSNENSEVCFILSWLFVYAVKAYCKPTNTLCRKNGAQQNHNSVTGHQVVPISCNCKPLPNFHYQKKISYVLNLAYIASVWCILHFRFRPAPLYLLAVYNYPLQLAPKYLRSQTLYVLVEWVPSFVWRSCQIGRDGIVTSSGQIYTRSPTYLLS